jgi:hypothetical protein
MGKSRRPVAPCGPRETSRLPNSPGSFLVNIFHWQLFAHTGSNSNEQIARHVGKQAPTPTVRNMFIRLNANQNSTPFRRTNEFT